jgi:hippurate hydrolase
VNGATLLEEAQAQLDDTIALRRRIHRRPELGLHLPATQSAIREALDPLGLEVELGRGSTSLVAILDGGRPGRTILLRADMDALPLREETGLEFASEVDGAMHACGHDAHVAMLVGAARLLAARRGGIAGRVVFMFQPGEEGRHGARVMIEEGLLDGPHKPDAAFALHCWPTSPAGLVSLKPGTMLASDDNFVITIRGRGGHASMPHEALDPIPIACAVVQAIQTYVTRRVNAFDPAVVTVGRIDAGTTFNVIPETARLLGTIRTVSERTREKLCDDFRGLVEGIAAAHGAQAHVDLAPGYPVTVNHAGMTEFVSRVAREAFGAGRVRQLSSPVMGAEDFSYVLQRIPGAIAFLGARPEGTRSAAPVHSNRMLLEESVLALGSALHASVALRFLLGEVSLDHSA